MPHANELYLNIGLGAAIQKLPHIPVKSPQLLSSAPMSAALFITTGGVPAEHIKKKPVQILQLHLGFLIS